MPEGPEVRRHADRVRRAVGGKTTDVVRFGLDRLAAFGPELSGQRVDGVESRGKALIVHFEGGRSVYTHNQLYGRWYVVGAGKTPSTRRQLRFGVETADKRALLYSASDIEVLDRLEMDRHPFLARLGPDALDPEVTADRIEARLDDRAFRGRQLGAVLLDQGFVAGLGNYLRSEILFFAGVAPERRARELTPDRRRRLAEQVLEVTRRAYRTGGITVEDELDRALKGEGLTRRARRHHVFARAGRPCRRCGAAIGKQSSAGRRAYVCPRCQG